MQGLEKIQDTQHTIDLLLKLGEFASTSGIEGKWRLEPLYSNEKCSVGMVHIDKKTLGPCKPHIHSDVTEFLICTSGMFILNINGNDVRTLSEGDCAVVKPGEMHYSKPLCDNTQMVYVCVPSDKGMKQLEKQLGIIK